MHVPKYIYIDNLIITYKFMFEHGLTFNSFYIITYCIFLYLDMGLLTKPEVTYKNWFQSNEKWRVFHNRLISRLPNQLIGSAKSIRTVSKRQ